MKTIKGLALLCVAFTALPTAGSAHHSFAMFDMQKDIMLEGTVTKFQWTNPHIWIQMRVTDESGTATEWSIEGGSPNMLTRYGWSRDSLKTGDKAVAVIHPLKKPRSGATVNGGGLGSISVNGKSILGYRDPSAVAVQGP